MWEAMLGAGIPVIRRRGRYSGEARCFWKRKGPRYGYARHHSNLCPILRHDGCTTGISYPVSSLLSDAKSINNKTTTLQSYLTDVHMACVTETWAKEGETVALMQLTHQDSPPVMVNRVWWHCCIGTFSFRTLPAPKSPAMCWPGVEG